MQKDKSRQDKLTFGMQVSSLRCSIQVPDKFKDILKTPFDKIKDKITFGAIPDKRRLLFYAN